MRVPKMALLLLSFLLACSDSLVTSSDPPKASFTGIERVRPPNSTDSFFRELENRVEGFSGLLIEDDKIVVLMTSDGLEAAAQEALSEFVASRSLLARTATTPVLEFRRAIYTWSQLEAWSSLAGAFYSSGVLMIDVDERNNEVWIGIRAGTDTREISRYFSMQGVPADAYAFEVIQMPILAADLNDRIDPMPGGISIERNIGDTCTLGANADYGSTRLFVTASHCTNSWAQLDSTDFYQATLTGSHVAEESHDPSAFSGAWCPSSTHDCRWSDAALATYASGIDEEFAKIAVPAGGAWRLFGTTTISTSTPRATISSKVIGGPVVGDTLDKIGRRTGWTFGEVDRTCVDQLVSSGTQTFLFLCSSRVQAGANNGDSGAPTFQLFTNGTVGYYGVVFAKDQTTDDYAGQGQSNLGTSFWFSPIDNIEFELEFSMAIGTDDDGGGS